MTRSPKDTPGLGAAWPLSPVELGAALVVEGLVASADDLLVRGQVRGRIRLERRLVVERGARVEAEVEAAEVIVRGVVRGRLRARERIVLSSSADVEGDVEAPVVEVEEGARLLGRVLMAVAGEDRRWGAYA